MRHQNVVQGKKILLRTQRTGLHPEISLGHGGGLSVSVSTLVIRETSRSQGCKGRRRLRLIRIVKVEEVAAAVRLDSNSFPRPQTGQTGAVDPGWSAQTEAIDSLRIWFCAT